jgi:MFS family permease
MYGAAAAWLMTSLSRDTLLVSLVQVAASLPLFVFAIPAGALADVFDRRRFLLCCQAAGTVLCAAFAIMVAMQRVTPVLLLIFVTLIGVTTALMYPVWQSIVPTLVPRSDLDGAIAANSAGVNVSRAIGPALGGVLIGAFGIASPFFVNACSNLGFIGALAWWHPLREIRSRAARNCTARCSARSVPLPLRARLPFRT